jgi:hypothetical protein
MKRRVLSAAVPAALIAFIVALPAGASAQDGVSRTEYSVRFFGFPIADAVFTTTTEGRHYRISGKLRSAGLAEIFDPTRGTTKVSGTVKSDRLQAKTYVVSYTSGKKKERTKVTFSGGAVVSAEQTPKPKKHGDDWVPVTKGDLQSVLDPVSSLILPAGDPVCPRTVPVFDGETRADLQLAPAGRQPFSTDGFKGEAIACSVHFVPEAGYRKGNDAIRYLSHADGIEVWFARSPGSDFYAPVNARVPTRIGSVTVWATHFGG